MATGAKMSFNHFQSGKYGNLHQSSGKDMDVTPDMHLKMSKKIAQLTKVIYALNTKNDEHEAIIGSINEQHEEQLQQILHETRAKVQVFQERLGCDEGQQRRVDRLEVMLEDSQRHKRTAMAEFDVYKQQQEQRDLTMQTEHSQKLLAMSHEVLKAKKEFQTQLQAWDLIRAKLEREKVDALETLMQQQRQALQELTTSLNSTSKVSSEHQRVQQQYKAELAHLTDTYQALLEEKGKMANEFEAKMDKAQAFFDKELHAMKSSQSNSAEDAVQQLQEEHARMIRDFALEKSELTKRIDSLINELSVTEEDLKIYKEKAQQMEANLENNNSCIADLGQQLTAARADAVRAGTQLRCVETELAASAHRCDQQAKELLRKSDTDSDALAAQLGKLEATKLQLEKVNQDLQAKLTKASERVKLLEAAKRALELQTSEDGKVRGNEMRQLQNALDELSTHKDKMAEEYERRLKVEAQEHAAREKQLEESHRSATDKLRRDHEKEAELMKRDLEKKLRRMKEELAVQLDAEMSRVLTEKKQKDEQYDQTRAALLDRLAQAEAEVARLTMQVKDSKHGLGSATTDLKNAHNQADRLKSDLEATKGELRMTKSRLATLQKDHDAHIMKQDQKLKDAKLETKRKLEELQKDLDHKWSNMLRTECEKTTEQFFLQKEDEKKQALAQLTKQKDAESESQRYTMQQKINDLKRQVATLQVSSDQLKQSWTEEMERIKLTGDVENSKLRDDMLTEAEEYAKKIESLEVIYARRLTSLEDKKTHEIQTVEQELKAQHAADMQTQLAAHSATEDSIKQAADEKLDTEMRAQKAHHDIVKDAAMKEVVEQHTCELDILNHAHQQQVAAARMELERAIDITKQKEIEFNMKMSELQDDVRFRERTIETLESEMKDLQSGLSSMTLELEEKSMEILKVRSDTNRQVKAHQTQLKVSHEAAMTNLSSNYLKEKQEMLAEFTEAQQLLKDKISAMKMMLEAAEEQYRNRESREDDLQTIQHLKSTINEREQQLRKLTDEKKKFQMELVNRETNFNKMFNASPSVGVLNPLSSSKPKSKKGDKQVAKLTGSSSSPSSVGSRSDRLDPLPNSPLHKEQLNHARPLPPTKKFSK